MKTLITILLNLFSIAFIALMPQIIQLTEIPLYYGDPMRVLVIISLVHTNKWNASMMSVLLPLTAILISLHPITVKSLLMMTELLVNLWLYIWLFSNLRQIFISMFLSIFISKSIYYLLKYICIQLEWMEGELVSTPFVYQFITAILLSIYAVLFREKKPFVIKS